VPTGQPELFPVIADAFPHKRFPQNVQCEFVSQALKICEYVPYLQQRILDLIVSKCLEIDVEIVIEDTGEVKIQEEYTGESEEDVFGLGPTPDISPTTGSGSGSGSDDPSGVRCRVLKTGTQRVYSEDARRIPEEVAESADKLDGMLVLVVDFITKDIEKGGNEIDRLGMQLVQVFEDRILLTHRSKFVQFLLFYLAGKSSSFGEAFAMALLRIFLDESVAHLRRQSSILYLASYLARAKFLSDTVIE
jgi:RNA polymerase I-specific transcription initiation factor RRN3